LDEIRIRNCTIATVDKPGTALNNLVKVGDYPGTPAWEARKFTRVIIRGNKINDVAKNAMIIRLTDETGLIEHNVRWDTAYRALTGNTIFSRSCRGTVFQFNEGYRNRAGELDPTNYWDGSLYDADIQSPGCIFQYNKRHDTNQGLFLPGRFARHDARTDDPVTRHQRFDGIRKGQHVGCVVLAAVLVVQGLPLVGVDQAVAVNEVSGNDWVIETERERSDEVPEVDHVVRTVPAAGEMLDEGETFVIVVSDGPELRTIPELAGMTLTDVQAALTELRLVTVEGTAEFSETVPAGSVLRYSLDGTTPSCSNSQESSPSGTAT